MIRSLLLLAALCASSVVAAQRSGFEAMDANHDGRITAHEHAVAAERMFRMMDVDGDGRVTA